MRLIRRIGRRTGEKVQPFVDGVRMHGMAMSFRAFALASLLLAACSPAQQPVVEQPSPTPPLADASASAPTASDASSASSDVRDVVVPPVVSSSAPTDAAVVVDAGRPVDAGPPRCPATFGGEPIECGPTTVSLRCTYPQGTCSCQTPPQCGGAYHPPGPPQWTCEKPKPPCPRAGTACKSDDTCFDGPCHFGRMVHCENGVWVARTRPPPP